MTAVPSWLKRRPFLALAALALTLRAACAVVTEYKPLFPAYYYTDANQIHEAALHALNDVRDGRELFVAGPLSLRLQVAITLDVYRVFGPRPLAIKLVNALLGALGVAALAWALSLVFSVSAAVGAGALLAVWPSHIFYTSQNLKEAPVELLAYAALGAALAAGLDEKKKLSYTARFALVAALALFGAGCYRSYVLVCLTASLLLALGLKAFERRPRANALLTAAFLASTLAVYPTASRAIFSRLGAADSGQIDLSLVPVTYDQFESGKRDAPVSIDRPTSPEGITRTRKWRQYTNRLAAANEAKREIGTQIYPNAEFKTWGDVLAYLPKGAFTVLFMPLPGLYPMDGKLGRYAAAGENLILLLIAALAGLGFIRGPKTPARLGLLAFFAAMTAGAALLEYDLGSAGRHKLMYFPMLFPFAVEEAQRLLALIARRAETRL